MLSLSKHDSTYGRTTITKAKTDLEVSAFKNNNIKNNKQNYGKSPFTISSIFNFPSRHNRPNRHAYSCHRLNVVMDNYF